MRFVAYGDRKKIVKGMKEFYTAPTLEAAELGFAEFEKQFGAQYPGAVDVWRHPWTEFIPFLCGVRARHARPHRGATRRGRPADPRPDHPGLWRVFDLLCKRVT